ncbi:hypothetical protein AC482_02615 [miscellaneous Crenarchaeota group-15 archaeon DG-45]|uniref:Uncharacterized protein n=1 Tax=miscellaneous Crenarchaeota group-15 archaeon DG-45 TaxID=1685127 RepID=A0A0M0BR90_9ARCH|nr:MAG: hypothetical protein AC482_02615 [miscellaneous Crenarchaeota group-15 archaeon DG-45]
MREDLDQEERAKMMRLRDDLLRLQERNVVKINHSVMELLCAKYLIQGGFEVELEHNLDGVSCDLYAVKGLGSLIVEVETGFVPPEHALDPQTYLRARIASKITRYSGYANKFCLGTPPYYIVQVPPALTKPPRFRAPEEIASIKGLCDLYYTSPPVTLEEIRNARLHSIYTLDVDSVSVREWEINEYMGKAALWSV